MQRIIRKAWRGEGPKEMVDCENPMNTLHVQRNAKSGGTALEMYQASAKRLMLRSRCQDDMLSGLTSQLEPWVYDNIEWWL